MEVERQIRQLALPSLATLLVEPLLVAVDTTMVGRLGVDPLAGLSLASTVISTIVGICIFLAYATTATTARFVGAGKHARALRAGVDGLWLGLTLGLILAAVLALFAPAILSWFGPEAGALEQAIAYARASAIGLPGMLVILAANGTLRGFADTRTPLVAATAGAIANVPLNFILIYVAHLGIAGAGLGTSIAQLMMAAFMVWRIADLRGAEPVSFLPSGSGVLSSLRQAVPLIIRTLSLRGAILLQIFAATSLGTLALAANQIVMTMWNFAAYGLDALATAAQILVGQGLGARDRQRVHLVLRRSMRYGLRVGAALAVVFAGLSFLVPRIMSDSPAVAWLATQAMWVTSAALPVAALAYILDGVLIGAGDTRKLAWYMVASLALFAPLALAVYTLGSGTLGLLALWAAYGVVFMAARATTTARRVRGDAWMGL